MKLWALFFFCLNAAFYGCSTENYANNRRSAEQQTPPVQSDDGSPAPIDTPTHSEDSEFPQIQNELVNDIPISTAPTTHTVIEDIAGEPPHARICKQFIKPNGTLGKYGKLIAANILDREYSSMDNKTNFLRTERKYYLDSSYEAFSRGGNFLSFCPKFESLANEDKAFVWAWFFGALAYQESSCDETEVSNGGGAIGLLQLNNYKGRYWRGGPCSNKNANMKDGMDNVSCGIWIMKDMIKGDLYGKQSILGTGGFWEPLYDHWSFEWDYYFPVEKCR